MRGGPQSPCWPSEPTPLRTPSLSLNLYEARLIVTTSVACRRYIEDRGGKDLAAEELRLLGGVLGQGTIIELSDDGR